ncbi:MAG: family 1 encapsulin nanocompartment shell protein [Sedimentisphaerales bacterium]|jgi:uncharacterized linocin/CFP29 family protein
MSESFLHRDDAPFGHKVWEKIDQTVIGAAKSQLCGRRLLRTQGPYGLGLKGLVGGDKAIDEKADGAEMIAPCVIPLVMIQSEFALPIRDVAAFEQRDMPLDLGDAAKAALDCARQEDNLIFNGSKAVGVKGLMNMDGVGSAKLKQWDSPGTAADDVIQAVTTLDQQGFHGPYALGLSPELYNLLFRRYPQGNQTEMEHVRQIVTDGIVKTPALSSGGLLLCTSGPFANVVLGQDIMTRFIGPSGTDYEFTVSESVALNLTEGGALCVLKK